MRKILPLLLLVLVAAATGVWLDRARTATTVTNNQGAPGAAPTASVDDGQSSTSSPSAANATTSPTDTGAPAATLVDPVEAARAMVAPPPRVNDARPPPPRPASPTENHLLGMYGLRGGDQQTLLLSPRFDKVVDALAREASSDSLEMTRLYRAQLEAALKADKRFTLGRMECGAHLCLATASGATGLDNDINTLLMPTPNGPKLYALLVAGVTQPGNSGTSEYRVEFTIDPAFNAIEMPAPTR